MVFHESHHAIPAQSKQTLPFYEDITDQFTQLDPQVNRVYGYDYQNPLNKNCSPFVASAGDMSTMEAVICLSEQAPHAFQALVKGPNTKSRNAAKYLAREGYILQTVDTAVLPQLLGYRYDTDILMERLPGVDLCDYVFYANQNHLYLFGHSPLQTENRAEYLAIMQAAAQTLRAYLDKATSHNDIKRPQFLIWDVEPLTVFLVDPSFGITQEEADLPTIDIFGPGIPGTKSHMHKQKFRIDPYEPNQEFTARGDVHALAVVAFEGLVGRLPYLGNNIINNLDLFFLYLPIEPQELACFDDLLPQEREERLRLLNDFFSHEFMYVDEPDPVVFMTKLSTLLTV